MTNTNTHTDGSETTARAIYQSLLDDIGTAITRRDKAKYGSFFAFPHRIQTFETSLDIVSEDMLGTFFDSLLRQLSDLGVAELTRLCTLAEFVDGNTINGYHETKLINGSLVIVQDYISLSTLRRQNGVWKVAASQYAEAEQSLPSFITKKIR